MGVARLQLVRDAAERMQPVSLLEAGHARLVEVLVSHLIGDYSTILNYRPLNALFLAAWNHGLISRSI